VQSRFGERGDKLEKQALYDKILGSLAASCIGDALGCPTEQMTMEEIKQTFGGFVTDFHAPAVDHPFAGGRSAGQITDDASLVLKMAEAIIASRGRLEVHHVVEQLLKWAETEEFRFAGPTTRAAIERLRMGEDPLKVGGSGHFASDGTSNGAAMKIVPVGLANPGSIDGAVRDAITMSLPTHGTRPAIAGAAAIAAGVAMALAPGATVESVVEACLIGAEVVERMELPGVRIVPGPSIKRRIELAVSIAMRAADLEAAMRELESLIGTGLPTSEAVPTAIGLFVAAGGDPLRTVVAAANIGHDTDTIACMAGALAGALKGIGCLPKHLVEKVQQANNLDLSRLARELCELAS
jgi:ADP-ribosylglycohydrolase